YSQAPSSVFLISSWAARTAHAYGFLPPDASPGPSAAQHFFPAAALPSPTAGGGRRRGENAPCTSGCAAWLRLRLRVGRRPLRPRHDAQATVSPCGTSCGPKHLLPCTPPGVRHAETRAHPSNERCLGRFTRRHNGGSSRPLLA